MVAKAEKQDGGIWDTVKTIVQALLIAGIFRTLFFQPFWIPTGSMKDTLLIGDFLFVNKMAYGYSQHSCPFSMCTFIDDRWLGSEPERGDVIVFRHPTQGTDYIKRVVGLPGDTIQMEGGRLFIDGEPVGVEPIDPFVEVKSPQGPAARAVRDDVAALRAAPRCVNDPVALGGDCVKARAIETLPNGHAHSILDSGPGPADDTLRITVPEGEYFFMGDNRDNSADSRFMKSAGGLGTVPAEYLIGRADRVIFSSAGSRILFFWTWRLDRFYEKIV